MNQSSTETGDFVYSILDVIPSPIFVVDEDMRVQWFNEAAAPLFQEEPAFVIRQRGGDILHCLHAKEAPEGCGHTESCQVCPIRNSVQKSIQGQRVIRQKTQMQLLENDRVVDLQVLVTTAPFGYQDQSYVLLILEDISQLCS